MRKASLSELRLDQDRKTPSRWSLYFFNGLQGWAQEAEPRFSPTVLGGSCPPLEGAPSRKFEGDECVCPDLE